MDRRALPAACAIAVALLAPPAAEASRPQPPTSGELERATERFLTSEGGGATASGTSGGTGQGQGKGGGLFPGKRVVALYGAPQMGATIVGRKSVAGARKKLHMQSRRYARFGRPVVPGIDLVAAIATSDRGRDGLHRTRQPDRVIAEYYRAAQRGDGRLILDFQPGRSSFLREIRAVRDWVERPDVDVALDPEWNVGRKGRPGRTTGKVKARELNRVSRYLAKLVDADDLPDKALIVHQFRAGSVKQRGRVKDRDGVDVTLNFDGIGGAAAKRAGYKRLTRRGLFAGFSLFYRLDSGLMGPKQVAGLSPTPNFVLYQ